MGNQPAPESVRLTVEYSSCATRNPEPDKGSLCTGLLEGEQVTVKFQGSQHVVDEVASTAACGAAKKMYKVRRLDTGELYALKTPGQREDVFDHVMAAQVARDFGQDLRFVIPVLARVDVALDQDGNRVAAWEGRHVLLEPLLQGDYQKFVCRRHKYGDGTFIYHSLPQAFFHFSYESSGRSMVIWDLQGIKDDKEGYILTDPYIVHDGHPIWRYGKHHDTFRILHTECNEFCPCLARAT
eukprot:TRINITY_DN14351_c1_g2_i1.p1 TRINITY_DN14351_c1_g2~~TRINITY_DN14351_c1_g2_i1.p1  ORF type:complete len:240 (-),score=7.24 TRINITY_DN14351_c1_g2_i1:221-940(-)